ncbi:hypothetical protein DEH18_17575 [Streptomyces sp. NHF165]|uniref:hypothetical protein n=1 Tax=Streptomyces sp. NHF165 TaxID=2175864 RepID=UPI00132F3866|nr:hypothetical protein [Streptomyces sp. NHF165]QHF95376.1 hypothetical protein DEH18_17575 [Streptomyces sp. NHF165]
MKALPTSVVVLLVSEACNVNPAPVVDPGYEARTRARFVHVDQHPPEALTPPRSTTGGFWVHLGEPP